MISPCVAFNNHAGSTKSFDYVREHNEAVNRLDFITGRAPIKVDYAPGSVELVEQHDGTTLALRKLNDEYDVHDRLAAMTFMQHHAAKGQIVTGLLYVEDEAEDLHGHLNTVDAPLNTLNEKELCPGSAALDKINASLRWSLEPLDRLDHFLRRLHRDREHFAGFEQALEILTGLPASPCGRRIGSHPAPPMSGTRSSSGAPPRRHGLSHSSLSIREACGIRPAIRRAR